MSFVFLDLMLYVLMRYVIVVLKVGVDNFVKRKDVLVCLILIVLDVVFVIVLFRCVIVVLDGLVGVVKNLFVLVF